MVKISSKKHETETLRLKIVGYNMIPTVCIMQGWDSERAFIKYSTAPGGYDIKNERRHRRKGFLNLK